MAEVVVEEKVKHLGVCNVSASAGPQQGTLWPDITPNVAWTNADIVAVR